MSKLVRQFYDEFARKLLTDYVHGNPRIEAAIKFVLEWTPADAERVLDIGCGIGWSTWEIKRHCDKAIVIGVDISPKMIDIATRCFKAPGLSFSVVDITRENSVDGGPFDVVTMLDVYEHVPRYLRSRVHALLKQVLKRDAMLLLTFPSVCYQRFLRVWYPEKLQPVDEDVDNEDIERLARDIGGIVAYKNNVSIWRNNDYVHVIICRGRRQPVKRTGAVSIETKADRRRRVTRRLGATVTKEGVLVPCVGEKTICVVAPRVDKYSETFVRQHIERLPARIKLLYGRYLTLTEEGTRLGRGVLDLVLRGRRLFPRRLRGLPEKIYTYLFLRFVRKYGIQAVLAEFGPTGTKVMEACRRARIPFIVHFHGADAYEQTVLQTYQELYREMFAKAYAIIAVSCDMREKLIKAGACPEKVIYNPYGVDTEMFAGASPGNAEPIFVAVGRFVEKKAPHLTLLAFKQVLDACPAAWLTMAGDGKLLEACRQMVKAMGIEERVNLLGARRHAEIAEIMRSARAFVQHSVTTSCGDSEGTPVAVLEAAATGLPVVATRHMGIKDVVIEGVTGFLVDEYDVKGMAEKMILLAKNEKLAAELGRNAREHVCRQFTVEKSIGQLWYVIEEAINNKRF